jgi:hypothetical protein
MDSPTEAHVYPTEGSWVPHPERFCDILWEFIEIIGDSDLPPKGSRPAGAFASFVRHELGHGLACFTDDRLLPGSDLLQQGR